MKTLFCVVVVYLICVCNAERSRALSDKEKFIEKLEELLTRKDAAEEKATNEKKDFFNQRQKSVFRKGASRAEAPNKKKGFFNRRKQLVSRKGASVYGNLAQGKSTFQTSTYTASYSPAVSSRAVDGNTNSNWNAHSCSCTLNGGNQWWYVDLGATYPIGKVDIYNRMDCCSERLSGIAIYATVGTPTSSNLNSESLCGTFTTSTAGVPKVTIQCGGLVARYVTVKKTNNDYLTLCEVEVFPEGRNLAQGKSTYQTSTYTASYSPAVSSRAVDGNTNSNWNALSCSCTLNGGNQWWDVDLGAKYSVGTVVIYNRMDCCSERLSGIAIYVTNSIPTSSNMNSESLCGTITTSTAGIARVSVQCGGRVGRYVTVKKTNNDYLTLCEVEVFPEGSGLPVLPEGGVFGERTGNIAQGMSTYQTSTYTASYSPAVSSRAVDGNTNSNWNALSCSCTLNGGNQWWYVDLRALYVIDRVVIYNRMDCCSERLSGIAIYVTVDTPASSNMNSESLCGTITTSTAGVPKVTVHCEGIVGRYVAIKKTNNDYLTLCEVEVFPEAW